MKVNSVGVNLNIYPKNMNFKGKEAMLTVPNEHDEFVTTNKQNNKSRAWWIIGGLAVLGIGGILAHKAGWFKKATDKIVNSGEKFKNIDEAKKYFEDLGIDTIFRDVTDKNLPQLNRIKEDLTKLKELGVKFDKPKTLTVSDWHKAEEYEELCRQRGISIERKEGYYAFCIGDREGANHVFVNGSQEATDVFRHEMGHANHHRGHDSFWESKGITGHDFADKQLEILGKDIKIYRNAGNFNNIFHFDPNITSTSFAFPNQNMETRFVRIPELLAKMQKETGCYKPESLSEQVAYIFDGLVKGEKFSDEVMLYYDFTGGARIPNLNINGKTYDEYIESLYNNSELIKKLRENIRISKI